MIALEIGEKSTTSQIAVGGDIVVDVLDILEETKDNAKIGRNPSFIHPAAIVHSGAVIGQGVSIGPFCTVGSSAKLGNSCQLYPGSHIFGNTELGDHCILMSGAVVGDDLPGHTVIGCNNVIGHHSLVGIKCQDMKYKFGQTRDGSNRIRMLHRLAELRLPSSTCIKSGRKDPGVGLLLEDPPMGYAVPLVEPASGEYDKRLVRDKWVDSYRISLVGPWPYYTGYAIPLMELASQEDDKRPVHDAGQVSYG
ncbi:hypothetical protein TEA_017551 [Camellia sinensis var. sinensis]|uniref:UDP N-acetylglucosamine O-acyltransferase C-terminal domain-containing protein n=1 Tax=Camellia sinensis var. sinensis TaxID=542762 RepID=A0A4S4DCY5_CAMSN|nr:hypothetical protein TEA_017551 [Camellia sinensis var. sinensis]